MSVERQRRTLWTAVVGGLCGGVGLVFAHLLYQHLDSPSVRLLVFGLVPSAAVIGIAILLAKTLETFRLRFATAVSTLGCATVVYYAFVLIETSREPVPATIIHSVWPVVAVLAIAALASATIAAATGRRHA